MDYYQGINDDARPPKRPKTLAETPTPAATPFSPLIPPPIVAIPAPPSHPSIASTSTSASASAMFFKTRLCYRFNAGSCPNGDRCTFAHGEAELRPPPPNWEDVISGVDRRGSNGPQRPPPNAVKICRMFLSGGVCSYGERCTFRHVAEAGAGAGVGWAGLRPPGPHGPHGPRGFRPYPPTEINGPFTGPFSGPAPVQKKPCFGWQSTGYCSYGRHCIFSHQAAVAVAADVHKSGDNAEANSTNGRAAPSRPTQTPIYTATNNDAADGPETEFDFELEPKPEPVSASPVQGRGFQKMLRREKIAGIYGDSLDEE